MEDEVHLDDNKPIYRCPKYNYKVIGKDELANYMLV